VKVIIIFLFFISLAGGFVSGLAYERYVHREQCLEAAFQNNSAEALSEAEIGEILKALNSPETKNESAASAGQEAENPDASDGQLVGSRNSDKFYPADCRYAKLIKEENKVWFSSVEEGEKAGREFVECK
jgi:hypothetical protein